MNHKYLTLMLGIVNNKINAVYSSFAMGLTVDFILLLINI